MNGTRQRLKGDDWLNISLWIALALLSIVIVIRFFPAAFPQASIDFKYDRNTSRAIAEKLVRAQRVNIEGTKHAARFDSDDAARIFLERTVGLEEATRITATDVHAWAWHHRWFRPLVEEEVSVDVAPTGEITGFLHKIPEDRALPPSAAAPPVAFLQSIGVDVADLELVDTSERRLPKRVQRIFTWESRSIRVAEARYRHTVTVDGNRVTSYSQRLKVPDAWSRSYAEMRSKNAAAGQVDEIFNFALLIAAVAVFIIRLRRGDLSLRFLLGIGIAGIVLGGGLLLNSIPRQLAWYDTTTSYPAFLGQVAFDLLKSSLGTAMMLIVICGAGEVLYRERLPKQLAIPRIWTPKALASRRVFLALVLGYALVPMFIAYQVVFYLTANKFGAWSPAEVPYDDMLNTAFPWIVVAFAGFLPAFSEEFLSRAFAIATLQKLVRYRMVAIVLAGFIWGFGHAMYPNQPFWIRGVEVGIAGIVAGLLMDRFGLLPLLIWHYTIDAVYTATILFSSGNTYYIVSAAVASLVFAFPLLGSVVMYVRNRGFVPDEDLTNASMPVREDSGEAEETPAQEIGGLKPAAPPVSRKLCIALVAAAIALIAIRPKSPADVIDYRITKEQAKAIARAHVGDVEHAYVIAGAAEGFRSWNPESRREDGGSPGGGFDSIAATWMVRQGLGIDALLDVFRRRIEAATWSVRFFTPMRKEEIYVEVDPRTSRVVGFHKYQNERNAGPSLTQQEALPLARAAFARYGCNVDAFELKEALSFQQPQRRDWLFHFDERKSIVASAYARATVRIAGNELTQFNKTIKVPDGVYREAHTQTLLNVVLYGLQIAGLIALLAIIVTGLVIAMRVQGLPWKRPLRWTLLLSVIPIAGFAANLESMLFGYSTAMAWETFRVSIFTAFVRNVGLQLGLLFLALAGLEATMPHVRTIVTRAERARIGRSAVIAAITALAIVVITTISLRFVAHAVPSAATVTLGVSDVVGSPLPALIEGAQALFAAILVSSAIALYANALRGYAAVVTIAAVFCTLLDPVVTLAQAPLMLAQSLILAALVWLTARYVLGNNPLAWPLAVFTGITLQTAALLLQNQRPDLIANAIALIAFAIAAIVWTAAPRSASHG